MAVLSFKVESHELDHCASSRPNGQWEKGHRPDHYYTSIVGLTYHLDRPGNIGLPPSLYKLGNSKLGRFTHGRTWEFLKGRYYRREAWSSSPGKLPFLSRLHGP